MLGVFFLLYDTMFWVPTLNKNMLCIGSEWPKEINQSRGKSSKFGMSIFVFETVDFCWRNSSSMWTDLFFSFLKEVKGVVFSNLIVRQCEIASYLVSNIQKWNCFNHPKSSMSDCSPSKPSETWISSCCQVYRKTLAEIVVPGELSFGCFGEVQNVSLL